ncbi:hypothetical protein Agub_g2541, partial [Astrephomene gubernaculifera]
MSEVRPREIFCSKSRNYHDVRLELGIRRVLELQFCNNLGFAGNCWRCNRTWTSKCETPVFLTGLVDSSTSPPVVHLRLAHNRSFTCDACREAAAAAAGAAGAAAAPPAAAPHSAATAPAAAAAATHVPTDPRRLLPAATAAAAGPQANGEVAPLSGSHADPRNGNHARTPAATADGAAAADGKAAHGGGGLWLEEWVEARSSRVKGSRLTAARIRVSFKKYYLASLAAPPAANPNPNAASASATTSAAVAPAAPTAPTSSTLPATPGAATAPAASGAAPTYLVRLASPKAAAAWAARLAGRLGPGEAARLGGLEWEVAGVERRCLAHAMGAVADWVLAPQVLTSPDTSLTTSSSAAPLLVQLQPWAFAARESPSVRTACNAVRPSLSCLGGPGLGKPPTCLTE